MAITHLLRQPGHPLLPGVSGISLKRLFRRPSPSQFGKPDLIAGVATGAIAQGALVADLMDLPMIYVRASAKGHGRQNLIEGRMEPGQRVVVVEDLISTGGSFPESRGGHP